MVALRDTGLRELSVDDGLVLLRMLCDRRDELSKAGAQGLNRMYRLLAELVPGGVPTKKSVAQYRVMLAAVRPRDQLGRTRRRLAAEQLADLVQLDARIKTLKAELTQAVPARGSQLRTIHGIGPAGAARIPGRCRRHRPLPGPEPRRVLDRHRADRRLLRGADPAPALPRREPANQPRALHGRVRAAAPRHCRTRVLRPPPGSGGLVYYRRFPPPGRVSGWQVHCDLVARKAARDAGTRMSAATASATSVRAS
jgi:hypothetical protein